MNMTPIKKIILGLVVVCIAMTVITANNLTSVMMLIAAKNNAANNNGSAVVEQEQGGSPSAGTVSGGSTSTGTGSSGSTGTGSTSTGTGSSGSTSTGSSNTGSNAGSGSTGSENKDASAGSSNDATAGDSKGDAAQTGKKPETKAEIVEYFNKSVNAVKTNAKTVNQKHVTNYLAGATTISSGISGIYNMLGGDDWLDGMLKDNSQGEASYEGADITAKFPVEGQTWSSKLTEADVSSATCTESNGVYTIEIKTIADEKSADVKIGEGHAPKAFNVILPGVVNDNIPGVAKGMVGTATMAYPESTAVITVDAKTGNVLTAEYDLKWTINFDEMGIVLPFGTKALYEIAW